MLRSALVLLVALASLTQCGKNTTYSSGKNWDAYSYGNSYPVDNDSSYIPPRGYGHYGGSSGCEAGDVFGC